MRPLPSPRSRKVTARELRAVRDACSRVLTRRASRRTLLQHVHNYQAGRAQKQAQKQAAVIARAKEAVERYKDEVAKIQEDEEDKMCVSSRTAGRFRVAKAAHTRALARRLVPEGLVLADSRARARPDARASRLSRRKTRASPLSCSKPNSSSSGSSARAPCVASSPLLPLFRSADLESDVGTERRAAGYRGGVEADRGDQSGDTHGEDGAAGH